MKPTIDYLPQWHSEPDQELYHKLCEVLDKVVSKTELNIAGLRNKYLDYSSLNKDLTQMMIKEMGYEYITEALSLSEEDLQTILGYLGVIHAFKGTRPGFELCLQLMGAKYEITEWWEANPTRTPDTFSLVIDLNLSGMKKDTMVKFRDFVRQYVYPVMDAIEYTFSSILADLSIRMGGVSVHEVRPSETLLVWLSARLAGPSIYDASSKPYNSASFWQGIQIGGASRIADRGQILFFPEPQEETEE